MKRAVASTVRGRPRPCVSRARVFRADGTTEVYYSLPRLPLLDVKGRLWVRRRLRAMRAEDRALLGAEKEAPRG